MNLFVCAVLYAASLLCTQILRHPKNTLTKVMKKTFRYTVKYFSFYDRNSQA